MGLIDDALATANARPAPRKIDYDRMNRTHKIHKAALTRAKKTGDPEKIAQACVKAMNEWDEIGCWPDDWNLWQIALNDALPWHKQIDLRDLPR